MMEFIFFTGEENEKEFLEKCYKQWRTTMESDDSETQKIMQLATVFSEINHRLDEL